MSANAIATNDSVPAEILTQRRGELTAHRPTLSALTGIRFLAAMLVVFYHSKMPEVLLRHRLIGESHLIANGNLAVPLFFVLSGFILSYTYESQIARPSGTQRFWEARFARVWPLYAFSLLCSSMINHRTPTLLRGIATLLMVQAWNPADKGVAASWNFVCWTLSTEALFYVSFPLLQLLLERWSSALQLAVLGVSLALSVRFATGLTSYVDGSAFPGIPLAAVHLPEFIAGVCAGNLFLRLRAGHKAANQPLLRSYGLLTWFAVAGSVFLLCHRNRAFTAWTTVSFTALLFGLAAEQTLVQRFLSARALIVGGQISYGIYLLQWPCKAGVNGICDVLHVQSANARFGIDCVVLIAISAACFYLIEEPARKVIRGGFARLQAR